MSESHVMMKTNGLFPGGGVHCFAVAEVRRPPRRPPPRRVNSILRQVDSETLRLASALAPYPSAVVGVLCQFTL